MTFNDVSCLCEASRYHRVAIQNINRHMTNTHSRGNIQYTLHYKRQALYVKSSRCKIQIYVAKTISFLVAV